MDQKAVLQKHIDNINKKLKQMTLKIGDSYDAYRRHLKSERDRLTYKIMLVELGSMDHAYGEFEIP